MVCLHILATLVVVHADNLARFVVHLGIRAIRAAYYILNNLAVYSDNPAVYSGDPAVYSDSPVA